MCEGMTNNILPKLDAYFTGQNIKRIMESKDMTVKDLQEYLGLQTPQSIYHWFNGRSMPTIDNLYYLSKFFMLSIDQIICDETKNGESANGEIRNGKSAYGETKNGESANGETRNSESANGENKNGVSVNSGTMTTEGNHRSSAYWVSAYYKRLANMIIDRYVV